MNMENNDNSDDIMWFVSWYSMESLRRAYQLLHFDPHTSDDNDDDGDHNVDDGDSDDDNVDHDDVGGFLGKQEM